MFYAQVDEDNRIVVYSNEPLDGMTEEFANGDFVDEKCVNGVRDFVIRNGQAYFEPTEESAKEVLERKLAATASEDVETALCELAEQQATYEADVNAALCELYELISGGDQNG